MARFGQVASCRLVVAHDAGAIAPVGFVTFKDKDEAERFVQLAGRGTQPTRLRVAGPCSPMRRAHGAAGHPSPPRPAGGVRVGEGQVTAEWKRDYDSRRAEARMGDAQNNPIERAIAEARDLIASSEGRPGGVQPAEEPPPDRQLQVYDDI